MDVYILVDLCNVTVYDGKNVKITCICNMYESHKWNVCIKEARHEGIPDRWLHLNKIWKQAKLKYSMKTCKLR